MNVYMGPPEILECPDCGRDLECWEDRDLTTVLAAHVAQDCPAHRCPLCRKPAHDYRCLT